MVVTRRELDFFEDFKHLTALFLAERKQQLSMLKHELRSGGNLRFEEADLNSSSEVVPLQRLLNEGDVSARIKVADFAHVADDEISPDGTVLDAASLGDEVEIRRVTFVRSRVALLRYEDAVARIISENEKKPERQSMTPTARRLFLVFDPPAEDTDTPLSQQHSQLKARALEMCAKGVDSIKSSNPLELDFELPAHVALTDSLVHANAAFLKHRLRHVASKGVTKGDSVPMRGFAVVCKCSFVAGRVRTLQEARELGDQTVKRLASNNFIDAVCLSKRLTFPACASKTTQQESSIVARDSVHFFSYFNSDLIVPEALVEFDWTSSNSADSQLETVSFREVLRSTISLPRSRFYQADWDAILDVCSSNDYMLTTLFAGELKTSLRKHGVLPSQPRDAEDDDTTTTRLDKRATTCPSAWMLAQFVLTW
ncbi:MAG: hypothetical protein MHM6MM_004360 [Cercozoa sp. M6MM]